MSNVKHVCRIIRTDENLEKITLLLSRNQMLEIMQQMISVMNKMDAKDIPNVALELEVLRSIEDLDGSYLQRLVKQGLAIIPEYR